MTSSYFAFDRFSENQNKMRKLALLSTLFSIIPILSAANCAEYTSKSNDAGLQDAGVKDVNSSDSFTDVAPIDIDATVNEPDADVINPVVVFDINHIISSGQSNSIANGGTPVLTKTQPYKNKMFNTGVIPATQGSCDGDGCTGFNNATSFLPLVEGDSFLNFPVETMSSGLANQASRMAQDIVFNGKPVYPGHDILMSLHGRSGNAYACLRKGGCPDWYPGRNFIFSYDEAMRSVADGKRISEEQGLTYAVRALTLIHGESDHYGYSILFPMASSNGVPGKIKTYEDALVEMQSDYENGVKAITGQNVPVPLYVSQMHSWTGDSSRKWSPIVRDEYLAQKNNNGKIIVVAPTYQLQFAPDGLHFTSFSERKLGQYFAHAYVQTTLQGKTWQPLKPKQLYRFDNIVYVKFLVPSAPIVLDTTNVSDPGNYGFEFADDSGNTPQITRVEIINGDTVKMTLSAVPTGNKMVRYAWTRNNNGATPGPFTGVRGNLRDTDTTVSEYGDDLWNWGISFEESVQ